MRMLNLDFSIIGVTETWLSDVTCDLYGMGGYEFIEKHRTNKVGRGIGFFVKNGVNYRPRADLTILEHYCESICSFKLINQCLVQKGICYLVLYIGHQIQI